MSRPTTTFPNRRTTTAAWLGVVYLAVSFVGAGSAAAQTYPGESWSKAASPEAVGWSSDKLKAARAYTDTISTAAVMIVHRGTVVDEWGETTRRFNVHSVRKSLISAMYGVYVDDGTIDLESTLEELGIDDRLGLTKAERQARVVDLLGSRSGVYHPANLVSLENSRSWPKRGSHAPGTHWFYNNWDFNVVGTIFEQQTAIGIFEAFDRLIAKPIGMQDYETSDGMYEPRSGFDGAQGRSVSDHPAYAFRMTARDMARFGYLLLRNGRWNGRQILPRDWIEKTTKTDRAIGEYGGYEFLWWISIDGRLYPNVNVGNGAYAAHGAGGHRITVMPEHDLVVVHRVNTNGRTAPVGGTEPGESVSGAEYGELLRLILAGKPASETKP